MKRLSDAKRGCWHDRVIRCATECCNMSVSKLLQTRICGAIYNATVDLLIFCTFSSSFWPASDEHDLAQRRLCGCRPREPKRLRIDLNIPSSYLVAETGRPLSDASLVHGQTCCSFSLHVSSPAVQKCVRIVQWAAAHLTGRRFNHQSFTVV